jgi:hypothetical protein
LHSIFPCEPDHEGGLYFGWEVEPDVDANQGHCSFHKEDQDETENVLEDKKKDRDDLLLELIIS